MIAKTDKVTKRWTRNESDERAVAAGYRFSQERADHILEFIESNLCLYEGEFAGQPVRLMPWQIEVLSRIFGWEGYSDHWGRWVRRFKKASLWIPKKNGKSPTAAMVGLYLLAADGEMGQKVFSGAKDGKQAQIVHTHARQMVLMSPLLSAACTINKSTGRITYEETVSYYDVLSGDNIQGQEGLNGSVVIDEAHVVDERLAQTLEYMGASRSEPMQFIVSTAGDNTASWGKRVQDYGRMVTKGDVTDHQVFCQVYEADQSALDSECEKQSTWKLANPSLGHILDPKEMQATCERAKPSLGEWVKFKQYRLNIWAGGTNPLLKMDDWARCKLAYTEQDLYGEYCYAGLDLARKRDMTALVLLFQRDDDILQLPYFWLPEGQADKWRDRVAYLQWHQMGHLRLTPGDVTAFDQIEQEVIEILSRFRCRELAFDPYYAEEMTQHISEATGVERIEFKQTAPNFAGPTVEYENRVIAGTMRHNANPILTWQAGNLSIEYDRNANMRPVKPENDDHRKIDGMVAAIMALARLLAQPTHDYVYNRRGAIAL